MPNGHIDSCHYLTTGTCTCEAESDRHQRHSLFSLSLFLLEVAGGIFTGSLTLLSDAFHTLFDGSRSILFSAFTAHRVHFTENEARLRKVSGVISAALILIISWFILDEALTRLDTAHPISVWAIPFASIAVFINWQKRLWILEGAPDRHPNATNDRPGFRIVTDTGASITALVGITLACAGVPLADPVASIIIVIVIWLRIMGYFMDAIFGKPGADAQLHHH